MTLFFKVLSGILISLILHLVLSREGKDLSLLLSIAVICMVALSLTNYLDPILEFVQSLKQACDFEPQMMKILMKAVGIGILTEITQMLCIDSGNSALGKSLQLLSAAAILWLSLPLFNQLLELLQTVLGAI